MSRRGRECEQKTAYETRERAEARIERLGAQLSPGVRAYACRWGDHWHVGHPGGGTNGRSSTRRRTGRRWAA